MLQDNNSSQNPQTTTATKKNTWIFIAVLAVLLVGNIYLFLSKNNVTNENQLANNQIDTMSVAMGIMQQDYDAALARLDMLTGKNAQLDSMVQGKDSEISKLRNQIKNILSNSRSTKSELNQAKVLIGELNAMVKSYEEQIAELKDENARLTEYNSVVLKERDETVEKNISLQQKVKMGAVLHASNIRFVPIDLRRGGKKEKETSKAKNIDIFRLSFDIDENRIAEDGLKNIYIKIIDANGNLLSNTQTGSGTTSDAKGNDLNYTLLKQINLKQNEPVKNITADWTQSNSYVQGIYTIELYNEGFKIGSGNITLK